MKKILLSLFIIVGFCSLGSAQITIFDNFDSYEAGDNIVDVNPDVFELWPNTPSGPVVSNAQAASPPNSIYLFSDSGGGPEDAIMTFGDKYDSGTASLSFNMYVSPGFGAYYNIQAEETAGISWASQVFFNANGTVEFQNSNNTVAASATYPQGEWFEVRYDVNLTENIWELSLGGRCLASYPNPENSFASFNLYPIANGSDAEFWFDDMRFEHSDEAQEIMTDAGLILGSDPLGGLEGGEIFNVAAMVNNLGEAITSATFEIDYDDAITQVVYDDINIAEGDTLQINLDDPILLTSGIKEIVVRITSVNGFEGDDVICNNSLFAVTTAVEPAPRKGVLVEEATGAWCTWCPRGAVFMERLTEEYGDLFVGVAVHNNTQGPDGMAVQEYDAGNRGTPGFTGFPSAAIEREMNFDPSDLERSFLERVAVAPRGAFLVGAAVDAEGDVDISVEVEALGDLNFTDRIMVAIIEDGVTGTGNGFSQVNAYAGGGQGPMGGYEDLPNPVPADQMVYDYVARALVTPYEGQSLDIPTVLSSGTKLQNYRFTLDPDWNQDNLSIVVSLINNDGFSDNAIKVTLADAISNGFILSGVNDPTLQSSFEVFPNPAGELMNVQLETGSIGDVNLEMFNIYGQLVQTEKLKSFVGKQNWLVNISELPNGVYSARVSIGNKTAVQKVQKFSK